MLRVDAKVICLPGRARNWIFCAETALRRALSVSMRRISERKETSTVEMFKTVFGLRARLPVIETL